MASSAWTILDLDRQGVTLVRASEGRGGAEIAVESCRSLERPADVEFDDAGAMGAWLGAALRDAGEPGSRVALSLSRGDVILKRLVIPIGEDLSDDDVTGAVRLQMSRQLSVSADGCANDYVRLSSGGSDSNGAGVGGAFGSSPREVVVQAAALPAERASWCRALASAAGFKARRIGLRCFGAWSLLAEQSLRRDGAVLGVIPARSCVEFVVIESGQLQLARAADLSWPTDHGEREAYADRVAVEAKRTWTSHRSGRDDADSGSVVVMGQGDVISLVSARCAASMERSSSVWSTTHRAAASKAGESSSAAALCAVGVFSDVAKRRATIDFLNPRRAPDRGARRRQLTLAGALGAIVLVGTPIVLARRDLSTMDERLSALERESSARQAELMDLWAEHARVNHMERWASAKVDWLAHLGALSEQVPAPPRAIVEDIDGTLSADVQFAPKSGQYAGGTWSVGQVAAFSMEGRVEQRETAAALRGRLAQGEIYSVESPSPDTGDRFKFELLTPYATPKKPPSKPGAKPESNPASKPSSNPSSKPAPGEAAPVTGSSSVPSGDTSDVSAGGEP